MKTIEYWEVQLIGGKNTVLSRFTTEAAARESCRASERPLSLAVIRRKLKLYESVHEQSGIVKLTPLEREALGVKTVW